MDWDRVKANWLVHATDAQTKWNRLTENNLEDINGYRNKLVNYLQDLYDYSKDDAEGEADKWCQELSDSATLVTTKIDET